MAIEFLKNLAGRGDRWISRLATAACSLQLTPATYSIAAGSSGWTKKVEVVLTDPDGNLCDWYNGTFPASVSKSSSGGSVTLGSGVSTVTLARGKGVVTITGSGTWASGDTATLTINASGTQTIFGKSVSAQTSVGTVPA